MVDGMLDDGNDNVREDNIYGEYVHDVNNNDEDGDDIYIMMQFCLSVTKNHHFLLGVSCNHPGWFFMVLGRFLWFFMVLGQVL